MPHSLTWEKGWYHINPGLREHPNKIRLGGFYVYYNATRGMIISGISEQKIPGEGSNIYTSGYGVEGKPEIKQFDFTTRLT